jgi:hypothetical protein
MSALINFVEPVGLLFQPIQKTTVFANHDSEPIQLSSACQPEERFWKLSKQAPKSATIELFVLTLFLVVALVAVTSCFAELSHLLQSDAIGQVAAKAIAGTLHS